MPPAASKPLSKSGASRQPSQQLNASKNSQDAPTQTTKESRTKANVDRVQKPKGKTATRTNPKAKSSNLKSILQEITDSPGSGSGPDTETRSNFRVYGRETPPTPTPSKPRAKASKVLKEDKNAANKGKSTKKYAAGSKDTNPKKPKAGGSGVTHRSSNPDDNKENIGPEESDANNGTISNGGGFLRVPVSQVGQDVSANATASSAVAATAKNAGKQSTTGKGKGEAKAAPKQATAPTTSSATVRSSSSSSKTTLKLKQENASGVTKQNITKKSSSSTTTKKSSTSTSSKRHSNLLKEVDELVRDQDNDFSAQYQSEDEEGRRLQPPRANSLKSKLQKYEEVKSSSASKSKSENSKDKKVNPAAKIKVEAKAKPYNPVNYSKDFGDLDLSEGKSDDEVVFGTEFAEKHKGKGKRVADEYLADNDAEKTDADQDAAPVMNKKVKVEHDGSEENVENVRSASPASPERKKLVGQRPSERKIKATSCLVKRQAMKEQEQVEATRAAVATAQVEAETIKSEVTSDVNSEAEVVHESTTIPDSPNDLDDGITRLTANSYVKDGIVTIQEPIMPTPKEPAQEHE